MPLLLAQAQLAHGPGPGHDLLGQGGQAGTDGHRRGEGRAVGDALHQAGLAQDQAAPAGDRCGGGAALGEPGGGAHPCAPYSSSMPIEARSNGSSSSP